MIGPDGPPEPSLVWRVGEQGTPLGALVVDRLVAGRACGGLRIAPVVTLDELQRLAITMTRKFAFLGIACGGAKAGLLVPADAGAEARQRRAHAFGAALAPLLRPGTYVTGTDLGCESRDLWNVLHGAGMAKGAPPARDGVRGGTGEHAGRSAAIAALEALAARGRGPAGATLAVAGYGRVGAATAARFVAAGGRLIAVSTAEGAIVDPAGLDLRRLETLRARHGDALVRHAGSRRLPAEDLLGVFTDVVAPCATSDMIDRRTATRLRCHVVAPGANAAVTDDAERILTRAGVTVLPDFVSNAGGVLVAHLWPLPLPARTVDWLLEVAFRRMVAALLSQAARAGTPVAVMARALAERNVARLAAGAATTRAHEQLVHRLGRSRLARRLPALLVTRLVVRLMREMPASVQARALPRREATPALAARTGTC